MKQAGGRQALAQKIFDPGRPPRSGQQKARILRAFACRHDLGQSSFSMSAAMSSGLVAGA